MNKSVRVGVIFLVFVLFFSSCRAAIIDNGKEETTIEIQFTHINALTPLKPLPDEPSAEIENNAKVLLCILPIDENIAMYLAETLYSYYLPAFAKAEMLSRGRYDFAHRIQVTGADNIIYKIYIESLGDYRYVRGVWAIDENGNEIEIFYPKFGLPQ